MAGNLYFAEVLGREGENDVLESHGLVEVWKRYMVINFFQKLWKVDLASNGHYFHTSTFLRTLFDISQVSACYLGYLNCSYHTGVVH